jgi:cytochrome c-type biogenesis protein CcmE
VKLKYILGILIILIFFVYAAFSFRKSLTPYVSFDEAKKSNLAVQTIGNILHQETSYNVEKGKLYFVIEDKDNNKMKVEFGGVKPGNFDQATTAVIVGQYRGDIFVAEKVLVKCPSKYQGKY